VRGRVGSRSGHTFSGMLSGWIDAENPVRVIDAFVEALDLGELGRSSASDRASSEKSSWAFSPFVLGRTPDDGVGIARAEFFARDRPCRRRYEVSRPRFRMNRIPGRRMAGKIGTLGGQS